VSGINAPPLLGSQVPLQGFEFFLNFNAAVLSATGVSGGGFLLPTTFAIPDISTPGLVHFAELSLATPPSIGSAGKLASISFNTIGQGTSLLNLNGIFNLEDNPNGVALTAPFEINIPIDMVKNGSVNFVPIPGAALLFGTGLIGLIGIARRKALATKN